MRYLVVDTGQAGDIEGLPGMSGVVIDRFRTEESARALALQRLAYGDTGVVVVDAESGEVVYPPADDVDEADSGPGSGSRAKDGSAPEQNSHVDAADRRRR